jgi:hypothetical protein
MTMGFSNKILSDFTTDIISDDSVNQVAKDTMISINSHNAGAWDNAFLILIMGLYVCLFAAGFTMDSNPAFLIVIFL